MSKFCTILLAFLFPAIAFMQTTYTSDATPTPAEVQTLIDGASAGDIVEIQSGTHTWTANISISKAITLQGQGTQATIIEDGMGTAGSWSDKALIVVNTPTSGTVRITNLRFEDATASKSGTADGGLIYVSGSGSSAGRARIDNCHFEDVDQDAGTIRISGAFGVTDNCYFRWSTSGFGHIISHGNYIGDDGGTPENGDGSFNDEANWGTEKFWFVEDNEHDRSGRTIRETVDSDRGARWVYRYNTDTNTRLTTHGTDSGTNQRSTRAIEVYENAISGDSSQSRLVNLRGGSALFYSNTITNYNAFSGKIADLQYYRRSNDNFTPWDGADGVVAWDNIDTTDDGTGYDSGGTANDGIFETGTVSTGGTRELTVSGTPWSDDEWIGYTVLQTSGTAEDVAFGYINDNDANTLFWSAIVSYPPSYTDNLDFAASDTFEIRKVIAGLDMPGLGKGDLADTDVDSPSWLNQVAEPIYAWGNTINGSSNNTLSPNTTWIIDGTHYYDDGTEPIGYTPYTYPHPLRNEAAGPGTVYTGEIQLDGSGAQPSLSSGALFKLN